MFDSAIAGRFLGGRALGLDVLLETYLGVALPPSRQKDDWSKRPLTTAQTVYAAADVQHLFALRARLIEELTKIGRLSWVDEECAALAAQPAPERPVDPDAYLGVKGARDLPPRGLAIMRELWELRERLARSADRPPFKILGEDVLLRVAQSAPTDAATLGTLSGITPRVLERWGGAILAADRAGAGVARRRAADDPAAPAARDPRRGESPHRGASPLADRRYRALRARSRACCCRTGSSASSPRRGRARSTISSASRGCAAGAPRRFGSEILAALERP